MVGNFQLILSRLNIILEQGELQIEKKETFSVEAFLGLNKLKLISMRFGKLKKL